MRMRFVGPIIHLVEGHYLNWIKQVQLRRAMQLSIAYTVIQTRIFSLNLAESVFQSVHDREVRIYNMLTRLSGILRKILNAYKHVGIVIYKS